ncbi:MAG: class I SAM-dependent methyltransferase [Fuerstiella sp.]
MTSSERSCRVCGNQAENQTFHVREMLHGTREEYEYLQCGACGCLQLADLPEDLSQFYPPDYCAYKDYRGRAKNILRRVIDTLYVSASLPREGIATRLMNRLRPPLDYLSWARFTGATQSSRILDVGCGNGKLLIRMSLGGFRTLDGVDPFIREDINVPSVRIRKIGLREYVESQPEKYHLVMLHHAFEHVPDPVETLLDAKQLMDDDGFLLIRIPVADCYSREHYGKNWYSWDAPRHTYLHTMKSMEYLARKTGFVIRKVEHDATFHQLQNSEMYSRNIPGNQHHQAVGDFSRRQIREFKALTRELNSQQRGEQAAFFLQKAEFAETSRRAA